MDDQADDVEDEKLFDYVIIDEAGQSDHFSIFCALSRAKVCILAGD